MTGYASEDFLSPSAPAELLCIHSSSNSLLFHSAASSLASHHGHATDLLLCKAVQRLLSAKSSELGHLNPLKRSQLILKQLFLDIFFFSSGFILCDRSADAPPAESIGFANRYYY